MTLDELNALLQLALRAATPAERLWVQALAAKVNVAHPAPDGAAQAAPAADEKAA